MNFSIAVPRVIRAVVFYCSILFFAFTSVSAQQQSTDGTTPLALSPGAPAGSYTLSDFENVNLFNGTLNFSLELVKVGGRGDAGYPLMLRIDHKWLIQKEQSENQPPINIYTPQPGWWSDLGWLPIYSMGRMEMRQGGTRDYVIVSGCGYVHRQTLTRLTFTAPDGTEYELRDQATNGQPVNATCTAYNRGTVFVTSDGSAATFISDSDIFDYQYDNPANYPPSGYMMLRDGTRYRIDGGNVTWMRDRNGNKLTFVYDIFQRMTSVTDSLNRQVSVNYSAGGGAYQEITFKGFGGATRSIKVYFSWLSDVLRSDFTLLTTAQMFPELNGAGSGYYNSSVVSAVELPNGKQYQFRYNSYAELSRVILPTGGAIEYDYAAGLTDSSTGSGVISGTGEKHVYRRVIERRVYPDGASGSSYASRMTYSRPETTSTNAGYVTTSQYNSSGTLLTRSIHYFHGSARASLFKQPTEYPAWTDGREYKTETYASNGTTLLKKVEKTFQQRAAVSWWTGGSSTAPPNDVRIAETVTTLADTNQVSKQTFGYDDSVPYNNQNNLKEYDFGSGAAGSLARETRTTFLTSSTYTGTSVHVRNLPTQVSIHDGSGAERARTTYEYDNYAADSNHAALTNRSGISGFDSAFNTSYATRGNVTGTTTYFLTGGTVTGSTSSYSQFDIAGNVTKTIDARGYATELYYTDNFGAPNGEARTNSAPTELSGVSSYAFLTSVKNSLDQWTYSQYDFYLGRPVDGEDSNGVIGSGTYNDSLDRPTQIRRAAGTTITNQTTFSYDDTNRVITTSVDRDTNNDNLLVKSVLYDQMGRISETRQYEGGTNYIAIQSQYDVLGRLYQTSNPFRPWQSETAVWTTLAFDALGRAISRTTPDNAVTATSYSGNSTTVTDPALRKTKSVTDALGRLRQVYEDPDTLNYLTSYDYDVLDALTTVTQGSQTRTFAYDSLKRLTSATNPENGTISYQYDNNANLIVKTDARGVSAHFAYDALNRLTRRWYNGSSSTSSMTHNSPALPSGVGTTNESAFFYDSQTLPSGAPTFSRGSSTGRLVAVTYGTGSSAGDYFGYDALGREVVKIQQTGAVNYQISANYNLAGAITSLTYPSGRTTTYSYDSAGRATNFSGSLGDGATRSYASNLVYNSFDQITRENFGTTTPLYRKSFYNIRGQLFDTRLSSVNDTWDWNCGRLILYYSSNHAWGQSGTDNNGNVRFAETWIPPENATLDQADTLFEDSYSYDALNRLTSVSEQRINVAGGWVWQQQFTQAYSYDRYGNRTINAAQTSGTGINNKEFTLNAGNNRLGVPVGQSGVMSYDNAGNLTNDTYTGAGNRTYDGENKITSAWGGNNQAQLYAYDANGQRIRRTVNGIETWHIYGLGGELLAEYGASGAATSPQKEYGYRNGQLLITAEAGTPTAPSGPNFAAASNGGTATASSTYSTVTASNANNGDHVGTASWWADGTSNTYPDWLQVDFSGSKTISEIDVYGLQQNHGSPVEPTLTMTSSYALTSFEVQYWTGSAWATVPGGSVTGNDKVLRKFTFAPLITSKIRVYVTSVAGDNHSQIVEVEAYGPVNVAAASNGGSATASSTYSGAPAPASNTNNGDHVGTASWWADDTSNTYPDWLQVDFSGSKTIGEIDVYGLQQNHSSPVEPTLTMTSSYALTNFEVQYWTGSAWATVPGGSVTGNDKVWRKFTFAPLTTTKIRVYVTSVAGDNRSQIVEVEAYTSSGEGRIQWLVADHLGTPRMIVDQTGSLANTKRHDYLPFGEEVFAGAGGRTTALGYSSGDNVRQQFTSKERDVETGLDYFSARYYSSVQGRFTSPDEFKGGAYEFWLLGDPSAGEKQALPFGDIRLPQSLNKYQYCFNNPLKFIDPNGHDALYIENKDTGKTTVVIPVHFTGPSATQGLISEVISRASQLDTGNPNVKIEIVATDKPMHGVLNTMSLSPDLNPKYPKGEGVEGEGGKKGHIRTNGVGGAGKIVHDTLHFAGLKDRYEEGFTLSQKRKRAKPSKGYDNTNIMTSSGGTTLKPEQIKEAKNNKSTKKCSTENGVTKCK